MECSICLFKDFCVSKDDNSNCVIYEKEDNYNINYSIDLRRFIFMTRKEFCQQIKQIHLNIKQEYNLSNKICIISDIHFGKYDHKFFEKQLQYFEKCVFPYILENNITNVIQLGDIFDKRKYTDNKLLSEIGERFFRFFNKNKINLYVVVGNHDTYNRENSKYSPLYQYSSEYIIPIKNNKLINICGKSIALHSYYCNDFLQADIGCFHHDFLGSKMNKYSICENGIEFPNISYQKIYSGHYHGSNDAKYLKTPYQLGYESFGDKNGFIVLDLENITETFIENTFSQRFIKIYYYNKDNILVKDGSDEVIANLNDIHSLVKDNFLEVNIEFIDDKILVDNLLDKLENVLYIYNNYFVKDKQNDNTENKMLNIDDFNDIGSLFDGFIDTFELNPNVDKNMLKDDFLEIYRECK